MQLLGKIVLILSSAILLMAAAIVISIHFIRKAKNQSLSTGKNVSLI
jgi:cell division protein FtsL